MPPGAEGGEGAGRDLDPWDDPWDVDAYFDAASEADSEDLNDMPSFDAPVTPERAGEEFAHHLLHLWHSKLLSSQHICLLAHWASRAGATGFAGKLAYPPGRQSGQYSRHLKDVTQLHQYMDALYQFEAPMFRSCDAMRDVGVFELAPLHEVVHHEVVENENIYATLREHIRNRTLPPCYFDHPIARAHLDSNKPAVPISIYTDGTPVTRTDGALGLIAYNWLTGSRHLLAVVRKSDMCRCGCHGWCTLYAIFLVLRWSLHAFLRGTFPSERHDGSPFARSDRLRSAVAGAPLTRAAIMHIKCDLLEHATTWGLPSSSTALHPCPLCAATTATLVQLPYFASGCSGHPPKTFEDYDAACRRCEEWRTLTWPQFAAVRAALFYDTTKDGGRGRCLRWDVPLARLVAGDRIEPFPELPDVGVIDAWVEEGYTPRRLLFWRRSRESLARRRCPLFDAALGVTPASLGIDWLHVLSLGVLKYVLAEFCMRLFEANVYRVDGPFETRMERSVLIMKSELDAWYTAEQLAGRSHTQIQALVPGMFGSRAAPRLGLHGSETNHFFLFCGVLCSRFQLLLPSSLTWMTVFSSMTRILAIVGAPRFVVPDDEIQETRVVVLKWVSSLSFIRLPNDFGVALKFRSY